MNTVYYQSPCGPLTLCATEEAMHYLGFGKEQPQWLGTMIVGTNALLEEVISQLEEYFAGNRRDFDLPLKLYGTTFQQAVWAGLLEIPYGQTITYGQLAEIIGKPSAVRAVGGANHRNPISIIVPCHRVIGTGTTHFCKRLTGYGGGLENKERLLFLEESHR